MSTIPEHSGTRGEETPQQVTRYDWTLAHLRRMADELHPAWTGQRGNGPFLFHALAQAVADAGRLDNIALPVRGTAEAMGVERGTAHRWLALAVGELHILTVAETPQRWSGHATRYTVNDPATWNIGQSGTVSGLEQTGTETGRTCSSEETVPLCPSPPLTSGLDDDGRDAMGHTGYGRSVHTVWSAAVRHFPDSPFTTANLAARCPRAARTVDRALLLLAKVGRIIHTAAGWILAPEDGEGWRSDAETQGVHGRSARRRERHQRERTSYAEVAAAHLARLADRADRLAARCGAWLHDTGAGVLADLRTGERLDPAPLTARPWDGVPPPHLAPPAHP